MENKKPIFIVAIVLILSATAFFLVMLLKKQLTGTKNQPGKTSQTDQFVSEEDKNTSEKEKNKKEIEERRELKKQGLSDALNGEIIGISPDKKTITVKTNIPEQLDEDKIIDVSINGESDQLGDNKTIDLSGNGGSGQSSKSKTIEVLIEEDTEIFRMHWEPQPVKDNEEVTAIGKTEKMNPDALQAGMNIQVQTDTMLDIREQNSISANAIVINDQIEGED